MYITKDRMGNNFRWSRKGKNRECWVKIKECITKKCFDPQDCGTIDPKTQQKDILGICKTYYDGSCPLGYNEKDYDYLDMVKNGWEKNGWEKNKLEKK